MSLDQYILSSFSVFRCFNKALDSVHIHWLFVLLVKNVTVIVCLRCVQLHIVDKAERKRDFN